MTRTAFSFALAFALASTLGLALSSPSLAQDRGSHCAGLGETAAKVMEARQLGIDEAPMMALAADGPAAEALTWIVREAYEEPLYPSERQKQAAMAEFSRLIEAACLAG